MTEEQSTENTPVENNEGTPPENLSELKPEENKPPEGGKVEEELSKGVAARINKLQEQHQEEIAAIKAQNEERDNLLKTLQEKLELAEKEKEEAARSASVMQLAQKHGVNHNLLSKSKLNGEELESYAKELAEEIKAAATTGSRKIQDAAITGGAGTSFDPIKEGMRILAERKVKGAKK